VAKQMLDRLVDQEIFVQKAIEKKLDRDPKVVQLIEANRRQILAQAYVQNLSQSTTTATRADVDAFYEQHPELFSARRVYRLQQLQIFGQPGMSALQAAMKDSKSIGDVAKNLAAAKIGFNETTVTVSPEQLPMKLAEEFAKMKTGNMAIVPQPNGSASIAQILAVQDAPVPRDKAQAAVERFLNNQRQNESVSNELKSLKAKATITYLGEFDPKHVAETKPDLGATGPGTGAVTVDPKASANDPAGVVTVKQDPTSTQASGAVTVKQDPTSTQASGAVIVDSERAKSDQSGVVTVKPDAAKK
jgi:EpsD family peptidyl-prolyl cis-trans isomerase